MTSEERFLSYIDKRYFKVDSEGRIWRLARKGRAGSNKWHKLSEPVRAESPGGQGLYLRVSFVVKGTQHSVAAHRIVFAILLNKCVLPPLDQLVNHENGNKTDNHPTNLTLVTPQGNVEHARYVLKVGPWDAKRREVLIG